MEEFMVALLCSMINLYDIYANVFSDNEDVRDNNFKTFGDIVNVVLSIAFWVLCFAYPIYIYIKLKENYYRLAD